MNKNIFILISLIGLFSFHAQQASAGQKGENNTYINKVLCLDGNDNNVRTGMGIIENEWTLEAWIKGDGDAWKEKEVIIGGGEYSETNLADNLPLILKNGYLRSEKADLTASYPLDQNWHHVAATCNGKETILYIDGQETARKSVKMSILPGTIGVNDTDGTFGGFMDEVRIWDTALDASILKSWMNRPLESNHPNYAALKGYYTFDDFAEDMSVNWVGKGHQNYHLRNGRIKYKEKQPLAYAIENDNPVFKNPNQKQRLFNSIVIQNEWDAEQGCKDSQILKLRIAVNGSATPMTLTEINLDLSETTSLNDISQVHIYYTGQYPRTDVKEELFGSGHEPKTKMKLKVSPRQGKTLAPGINYFLVTFDINNQANAGNILHANVSSFKLNKKVYLPEKDNSCQKIQVTESRNNNPDIIKTLQWNIWHGGIHVGNNGVDRVIELIKASNADIITMQEAYGSQQKIAETLHLHMQTPSLKDNLTLFSRFPIRKIPTQKTFNSNPGILVLPDGREILVNDCWLRYAYRPEYTSGYANSGLDPNRWVSEDSTLALTDINNLLNKDIKPYLVTPNMPVIIGGDFNSCSHLDWTEKSRHLHYGYGPVEFPVSRYMYKEGFKDSFRELNPDEAAYQGGTISVIYGQMQMSRIDFLYYKGNIQAVSSKIVRSAPEIDDVWVSDHAAVLTVFKLLK